MQETINLQKQKPLDMTSNIREFLDGVSRINCQIDEICNQIRKTIRDFLIEWKHFSQKAGKEELIKFWENLGMDVDDEDSTDPIFWFSFSATINIEGDSIDVYLYVRKGDDNLYVDDILPDISYIVNKEGQEEYCIDLSQCNFDNLIEIMDAIYYSLKIEDIWKKILRGDLVIPYF